MAKRLTVYLDSGDILYINNVDSYVVTTDEHGNQYFNVRYAKGHNESYLAWNTLNMKRVVYVTYEYM